MISTNVPLGPSVHCERHWEYKACYKLKYYSFAFPFSFVALSLPVRAVHRLLSLPCALSVAVSYILKESSVLFIRISQPWNRVWHMVDAQRILVESMLMLN